MTSSDPINDYGYDLGSLHLPITTSSADAQRWFDRGLTWAYGFNKTEAYSCFERAVAADENCAMGFWGMAYASDAYYNKPWSFYDEADLRATLERTYTQAQAAKSLVSSVSPVEKALITAMQARHPSPDVAAHADLALRDQDYACGMKEAYDTIGKSVDIAVLYAESLMNLSPWNLWNIHTGAPTHPRTLEAKAVLERAFWLEGANMHPGLLHLYIHLIEMSKEPEKGLDAANRLRSLVPDCGHLNHMPSHLDVLVGDYSKAIAANAAAVVSDDKYLSKSGMRQGDMYVVYRAHDIQSLIYAAMLCGQSQMALDYSVRLEKFLTESVLEVRSPPMADWLEAFHAVRLHVLVRFGRWHDILEYKAPENKELYSVTHATAQYAKGVAWAVLGDVAAAEKEQKLFLQALANVPATRYDYPNRCTDILQVGAAMLAGEIAYRRGDYDGAFEHLQRSVELEDHLVYSEPWGWMQPTRHAYAALLLEQGRAEEACALYAADLGLSEALPRGHQHPKNIWALKGYYESLKTLGRNAEAEGVLPQLRAASELSDVPVAASCACAKNEHRYAEA